MEAPIIIVALGAATAGFVQGLSGFGFGMVAMSIWAWSIAPQLAAAMAVFGALTGQIVAAVSMRRRFHFQRLLPFVLGGLAGIPLGVLLLPHLDSVWFKAIVGLVLSAWCPAMLLGDRLPRVDVGGRLADGAIGALGGIMGGLGGFTGVIPTLWCTLRGFGKDEQRSIIQNFNLAMLAVTLGAYIATGAVTAAMLPQFAVIVPAMLVPTLLGARLYLGISEQAFKRVVLGLLTASGVAMLASSLPTIISRHY